MNIARRLGDTLLVAVLALAPMLAKAADAPVIESIVDRNSGTVLWSTASPDACPSLKPGQAILLKGRNFGSGPLAMARPGLGPPAGGVAPAGGGNSVRVSPPDTPGKDLSKVLFGNVRALERNLSSYRANISIGTGLASVAARLEGKALDYFVEPWVPIPDTWAGDIYDWNDTEIDLTVPITAYEGPIQIIRIPVTGDYVLDIQTGKPLLYRDPNTARVVNNKRYAFVDLWKIARTDETVLASNAVTVAVVLDGDKRLQYGSVAGPAAEANAARQALASAGTQRLVKATPTLHSAADQYAYGEKAYWAWDWNLAAVHFALGVDWDGIFGFDPGRPESRLEILAKDLKYKESGIPEPKTEANGYNFPELAADGTVKQTLPHKPMIDRSTGEGIRPFTSFGAIPLLPDTGATKVIAPAVAFDNQNFADPTPYPISMAFQLPPPFPKPLAGGETKPTGWAGYVFAQVASFLPGYQKTVDWIGFNCAACHAGRVTYEYDTDGKKVSRFFNGIPNPDWRATFLTLSGRTLGLVGDEGLPLNFIRQDYPNGTQKQISSQGRISGLLAPLQRGFDAFLARHGVALSKQKVDKTLLIYNLPPGSTEATLFNPADLPGDYHNDYFFSPEAIPIITNHTPVRRALSRSELIDGFEGAYLHGEEPEGARGPMSTRSLQDLTLYISTLHQDDELLRRIGVYRWLAHKGHSDWLGSGVNEGTFIGFGQQPDDLLRPASFPPQPAPTDGLGAVRDAAIAATADQGAPSGAFSRKFPDLAGHIAHGAKLFKDSCARCHVPGNAGLWTNEDMQPISAAGGSEPVGRFFSPTVWQRRTQAIRTAILQNLFWVQQRGLLSDGHVVGDEPDNIDGLDLLIRPERCQAPTNPDGSVASDLYKKLYTVHQGPDHSFRIPSAGMRFELYTRLGGDKPGVLQQISAPDPNRRVREEEERLVARHAYFTKMDDGYYYWDYQKMRREYGILEYGLDPKDPASRARIGGLPAAPHPWCMPAGSSQADIDDLVAFLLTL
jgi:mono/diheme cytochrome c family protein